MISFVIITVRMIITKGVLIDSLFEDLTSQLGIKLTSNKYNSGKTCKLFRLVIVGRSIPPVGLFILSFVIRIFVLKFWVFFRCKFIEDHGHRKIQFLVDHFQVIVFILTVADIDSSVLLYIFSFDFFYVRLRYSFE